MSLRNQSQYEQVYKPHGVTYGQYSRFSVKFHGLLAAWALGTLLLCGPNFLVLFAGWGAILYFVGFKQDPATVAQKAKKLEKHDETVRMEERARIGGLMGGYQSTRRIEQPEADERKVIEL